MQNDLSPMRWTFLTPWQPAFGVAALVGFCAAAAPCAGDAPASAPGTAATGKPERGAAIKIYIHTDLEGRKVKVLERPSPQRLVRPSDG
jgi:hypothetical protein